ncbi:MAG: 50S ribosomal protein L32 [Planctomycetota bacterium]|nr:50S ribosomal protein L32 [Planctomycetota bacterium]
MAVPKRKISRAQRGNRRAHLKLQRLQLVRCATCGSMIRPHTVCPDCGHYRGRQVLVVNNGN